jgi:hypothetical protein
MRQRAKLAILASVGLFASCTADDSGPPANTSSGGAGGSGGSSSAGSSGSTSDTSGSSGGGSSGTSGSIANTAGSAGMADVGGDAAVTEAGDEAGTGCSAGKYTLCDDFEGVAPNTAGSPWTFINKGGYVVELVTTQAHSGTHSVHATFAAGAGYAYISESKTFPATDWWARVYMRFTAPKGGHQVFAGGDTNMAEASGEQVRFLNDLGGGTVAMNRRSDDQVVNSKMAIPMGTWNCYEWHETSNGLHVFVDSQELLTSTWMEPTFVAMVLGAERFEGGPAGDVWIDDVVVNTKQVGCN